MGIPIVILCIMFPHAGGDEPGQKVDHIVLYGLVPVLLYHNPGCCSLGIDIDQAGLDFAPGDDGLHLAGDVIEAVVGGGGYGDGLLHFWNCHYLKISQVLITWDQSPKNDCA